MAKFTSIFLLTISMAIFHTIDAFANRRSLLSAHDFVDRSPHGRRRSVSISSMPGGHAQTIPSDVALWSRSHDECHYKEIVQNITIDGCEPKSIANRMCYGVCSNIHWPAVPGSDAVELCTKCAPSGRKRSIAVTLKCVGGQKSINVPVINKCSCVRC